LEISEKWPRDFIVPNQDNLVLVFIFYSNVSKSHTSRYCQSREWRKYTAMPRSWQDNVLGPVVQNWVSLTLG
jgi:hypothetical protein